MLPPGARGNITYIAPAGQYNINEEVIEVEFQGVKKVRACHLGGAGGVCVGGGGGRLPAPALPCASRPLTHPPTHPTPPHCAPQRYCMKQLWPVRSPRPVAQKHLADTPLLTGQVRCRVRHSPMPGRRCAPTLAPLCRLPP